MTEREEQRQYRMGALRVIELLEETAQDEDQPIQERLRRFTTKLRTALGAALILVGDDVAEVIEHERMVAALEQIGQASDACGAIARRALNR